MHYGPVRPVPTVAPAWIMQKWFVSGNLLRIHNKFPEYPFSGAHGEFSEYPQCHFSAILIPVMSIFEREREKLMCIHHDHCQCEAQVLLKCTYTSGTAIRSPLVRSLRSYLLRNYGREVFLSQ